MHVHMKPAEMQHLQAAQRTKTARTVDDRESEGLAKLHGEDAGGRRHRQDPRRFKSADRQDGGRQSLAAALAAFDLAGSDPDAADVSSSIAPTPRT